MSPCDDLEGQATCTVCGSDMTHVRPGKWQCDVCEWRDYIRRQQAAALRWAAIMLNQQADAVERGEVEIA